MKIYFIATTSIYDETKLRKMQYINGISLLKQKINDLNIENYKIIIVENNSFRETILNSLDCEVFYTNNNFLRTNNRGYKELKDVHDCINYYNINDEDFIVKITGRYFLNDDSEFMNEIKNINNTNFDCIIKYGSYSNPVNYKMNDCITGLIGMKCCYVKQIKYPNESECIEWKWAEVTNLIDDSKICMVDKLGIYICPGSNNYFLV
jgi:hypothetical protein